MIWCDYVDNRNRDFESFAGKILQNDWRVVDSELEITDNDPCGECNCYYTMRPAVGSIRPESAIHIRSLPPYCEGTNFITIEGPVGLPYE